MKHLNNKFRPVSFFILQLTTLLGTILFVSNGDCSHVPTYLINLTHKISPFIQFNSQVNECELDFSPESKLLLVGGDKGQAIIFDLATQKIVAKTHTNSEAIGCVSFLNKELIALGNIDSYFTLWNLKYKEKIYDLNIDDAVISAISYDEKSKNIYIVGVTKIQKWNVITRRLLTRGITSPGDMLYDGKYNSIDNIFATCGDNSGVVLWNPMKLTKLCTLPHSKGEELRFLDISLDGTYIVSSDEGGEATVWNEKTRKKLYTVGGLQFASTGVTISPNSKYFAVSGGYTFNVWNIKTGKNVAHIEPPDRKGDEYPPGSGSCIQSIVFSPDGKWLATSGIDGIVQIWDFKKILELSKQQHK